VEESRYGALLFIQHSGYGKRCANVLGGVKSLWFWRECFRVPDTLCSASDRRKRLQDIRLLLHFGGAEEIHGRYVTDTDR